MQPQESPTAQTMKHSDQDGSPSAESLMGTLLQGADGIVLSCDPVAEQLLGYSARQLVGTTAFDPAWQTIHPDRSSFLPEHYPAIAALRSRKPCRDVVMGFYQPDGNLVWLCLNSTPLFQPDIETPYAVVTTFHEIPKATASLSSLEEEASTSANLDPIEGKSEADVCRSIEEQLRVSEQRFRRLADSMPHIIFAARPDGSIVYVNRFTQEYTGLSSELLEQGWAVCVHPDDRDRVFQTWMQAVQAGESYEVECRFRKADGTYRWLLSRGLPIRDSEGQIVEWIGGSTDIHDRKQAEIVLQESEEKLRLFVQYAPAGVAMFDREMRYLQVSQQWVDAYGLGSIEAVLGRSHYEIFPEISDRWREAHQRGLAGATEKCDEDPFVRADGSVQWIRWEIRPWHDSTGQIGGIVIFSEEITQRKQAQQQLQQTLQTLETLVACSPLPIVVIEPDCITRLWNPAAERLFGWSAAEVLGQELPIVPEEKREECRQVRAAVVSGEIFSGIETYRCKRDGSNVILSISAAPLYDEQNTANAIVLIFQDITERQQAESALRDSEQRLKIALQTGKLGSWQLNLITNVLESSNQCKANFGLAPEEELTYERLFELIHPEDREAVRQTVQQAIATRTDYEAEYRAIWSDGSVHWILARGRAIYDDRTGVPLRMVGVTLDFSDRKEIEAALRESNERFQTAMQAVDGIVFEWNLQTGYVYRSEGLLQLVGVRAEDAPPTRDWWAERIHLDDLRRIESSAASVMASGDRYQGEYRVRHEDGHWVEVWEQGYLKRNLQGDLIGIIGCTTNITERKQAEEELRQSQAIAEHQLVEIEAIYQTAPVGLAILSPDLRFQRINQQLAEINGIDAEDHIGRTVREIVPDLADEVEPLFRQVLETGEPLLNLEISGETKAQPEEHRTWIENWYPIKDANGQVIGINVVVQEITDRKQAEAEREQLLHHEQVLRQQAEAAEAKLQQVLTSIREDFVLLDRDWHIAYLNDQATETLRLSYEEALGRSLWDLFPDLIGTEFYNLLHQVMRDRTPTQFEYYYPTWDRWFENRLYPAPDGIVNLSTDVTDRKRAELNDQFLNQLDARLRQCSNADEMALEVVSSVGRYLNVDRCVWNEIDSDAQIAIVKQDWYQQSHMPSVVGVYQLSDFALPDLIDLYHQGQPVTVADVTTHPCTAPFVENYIPYGTHAYVAVPCVIQGIWVAMLAVNASTPRNWRSDEVALLQEVVSRLWSIIEHTRAVEELRQSEVQFRQLANGMPQIVWVADANGTVEFTNDRWTEYTGLTLEQSRDPAVMRQIIPPEDQEQLQADFIQAQEARSLYQSQFRLIQPDGSYLHFLTRAVPILNEQGQVHKWYGTSTDISDRVQIERDRERILQQEQEAREAAENANRIKDEFLAVLSHELRSPLNPILGWSKLLQQGKLDTARTKTALTTIERNAQLQAQLIDDLLDISRILRGKLSLDQSAVDLSIVISSALETVRLAAEAKSLHIQTIVSPDVGAVMGDAGRLQQVVWNLLSNAVKFTPPTGQITISLTQAGTDAQIQVIDTGKGIKSDFLPYVFEHFRQEDGATTRKFGGLGLGLAIARQIVEMHGGQISVDSLGEGQGATFTVRLPLQKSEAVKEWRSEGQDRSFTSSPLNPLTGLHILVVDDEPDSREFVAFVLEQAGAIVTSFASGIEALQVIERAAPDLIVSDIGMPEMDGYMLMQQVRRLEQGKTVPAIALTAYAGEFDRQQALQAGFQRHLSKPIEPEGLIQAIVALIQRTGGKHGAT